MTQIGDIFSVSINEHEVRYFQLIAFDLSQMNSDVIRAFKLILPKDEKVDVDKLVASPVDFYAHCVTDFGLRQKVWEKAGYSSNIGDLDHILFRGTPDNPKVDISFNWWVWRVNKDAQYIGKLEGENTKAELGLVFLPQDIVHRMKTGKYDFVYPGY